MYLHNKEKSEFTNSCLYHNNSRLALVDAQRRQREFEEVSHQLAIDEFLWKKEKNEKANERHQKETQLLLNTKRLKKAQER